jgi:hypothetical protein
MQRGESCPAVVRLLAFSGLAAATPEIDVENNTAAGSYRSDPRKGIDEGLTGRGSDGAGLFRCLPAHREHR